MSFDYEGNAKAIDRAERIVAHRTRARALRGRPLNFRGDGSYSLDFSLAEMIKTDADFRNELWRVVNDAAEALSARCVKRARDLEYAQARKAKP